MLHLFYFPALELSGSGRGLFFPVSEGGELSSLVLGPD